MTIKDALDRLDERVLGDTFRRRTSQAGMDHETVVGDETVVQERASGDLARERAPSAARREFEARAAVRALLVVLALVIALLGVIIVLGIVFQVFPTNPDNDIVDHLWPAARALSDPFHNLFTQDSADKTIAVNYGIAAAVYFLVAGVVRTLARRV